jgi:hypothetical protein
MPNGTASGMETYALYGYIPERTLGVLEVAALDNDFLTTADGVDRPSSR